MRGGGKPLGVCLRLELSWGFGGLGVWGFYGVDLMARDARFEARLRFGVDLLCGEHARLVIKTGLWI